MQAALSARFPVPNSVRNRPKVLILSASVGAGHLRAAEALELALRQAAPEVEIQNIDVLRLASRTFGRLYGRAYLDLANLAPHLLGYVYDLLDRPRSGELELDHLRIGIEKLNMPSFLRLLESETWDLIVNTHFLPSEIIASLRYAGKIHARQVTIITDFLAHRLWVQQPCEHYFLPTGEAAAYLNYLGVPEACMSVTGIPIHPVFSTPKDRSACLKAHGLSGERPVILLLSGGFGIGPVEALLQRVLAVQRALDILVVCGHNERLKQKLTRVRKPRRHHLVVMGYTTRIDELMTAADVVVSKPGGLTASEVFASGSVLAIVNPIPGQESRNSDYILENQAAIKIGQMATLPYKLTSLLDNPQRLGQLKTNARKISRPRAAAEIVSRFLKAFVFASNRH
jgi:processive 1,2-diacylglycerol beta-glucosyltransferase